MRIISLNANGIRAAQRKGFFEWLPKANPDVVCLQETKAQEHQLSKDIFCPAGYYCYYHDAEKKGYSGVAIFSKQKPKKVQVGFGLEWADSEGRYIQADFDGLSIASVYLPSGTSKEERQLLKYELMAYYEQTLKAQRRKRREFILCGDWNIAHTKNDIKNWRSNQKNSGFLPEERAWLDKLFDDIGYVDAFRVKNQEADQYTWWSNRGRAWEKNVGWRIDYQIVTPGLKDKINAVDIYKTQRFSDHAPLIVDYSF